MSVILDVLKKLDREKPSRRGQPPHIATEILKPDLPRPKRRIPLNMIIVSLTAVVTAGITYVLMKEFVFSSKPSPLLLSSPPGPNQQVKPAPVELSLQKKSSPPAPVSPPVPVQQGAPAPVPREPVREIREDIPKVVPKIETVSESKVPEAPKIPEIPKVSEVPKVPVESKPSSAPPEEKKTSQPVTPAKKEIVTAEPPKKAPDKPVAEPVKGPPQLTLSVIVWYEDPSMRFAIVNGLKAVEGSFVEGVKVVEINRTSVRFLHNQKYFEVSISR